MTLKRKSLLKRAKMNSSKRKSKSWRRNSRANANASIQTLRRFNRLKWIPLLFTLNTIITIPSKSTMLPSVLPSLLFLVLFLSSMSSPAKMNRLSSTKVHKWWKCLMTYKNRPKTSRMQWETRKMKSVLLMLLLFLEIKATWKISWRKNWVDHVKMICIITWSRKSKKYLKPLNRLHLSTWICFPRTLVSKFKRINGFNSLFLRAIKVREMISAEIALKLMFLTMLVKSTCKFGLKSNQLRNSNLLIE